MLSNTFVKDNVKFIFVDDCNINSFHDDDITKDDCFLEIRVKRAFLSEIVDYAISMINKECLSELAMTNREVQVLKHLSAGLNNRQISKLMHISVHTTKAHIHSIFTKLAVQGRTEAVVKAIKYHLIIL